MAVAYLHSSVCAENMKTLSYLSKISLATSLVDSVLSRGNAIIAFSVLGRTCSLLLRIKMSQWCIDGKGLASNICTLMINQ